ncbi:MAG: ParA family protein [Anaerolineaceae bacterium]|nr:ParA family protein [Anaerolineaceae bacterium]
MAKIIAVSNQKGGVGKTTTCVSLGANIALQKKKVLIIDLDSQANLTMAVGMDPDDIELAIPDLIDPEEIDNSISIQKVIQKTNLENLDILPSDVRLAATEQGIVSIEGYEWLLANAIKPIQNEYDFVLIDCPPALSPLTLIALTAADMVLVPVQTEYYAARGLERLLETIAAVQKHLNSSLTYYLVGTIYDRRNRISRDVLSQLYITFEGNIFETVIGIDNQIRESAAAGEPIPVYSPKSRSNLEYEQLALEVIHLLK